MIVPENISAIILAGGKSSRMGSDKANYSLGGQRFLDAVINASKPLVNDILIVSDSVDHDRQGTRRIPDELKNAGPLSGLCTGLANSTSPYNLVLSCDIPFIDTASLKLLFGSYTEDLDMLQLGDGVRNMPLIAIYRLTCLPWLKARLLAGERKLNHALKGLNNRTLVVHGEHLARIQNINSPEQLDFGV